MKFVDPNTLCKEAMTKYDSELIAREDLGVVGVAYQPHPDGGRGKLAIFVKEMLPEHEEFSGKKFGSLTGEVIETGEISISTDPTSRIRPLVGGISVSHTSGTAGTITLISMANVTLGTLCIVSCAHVLCTWYKDTTGYSLIWFEGQPIVQPGVSDGGTSPADLIGTSSGGFYMWEAKTVIATTADTARCVLDDSDSALPELLDMYTVDSARSLTSADIGLPVEFTGRSSGRVSTTISYFSGSVTVAFGSYSVLFTDQIVTPKVSQDGDSGALLVDKSTHEAIGVLFAAGSTVSVYNRYYTREGSMDFTHAIQRLFYENYDLEGMNGITWGATSTDSDERSINWENFDVAEHEWLAGIWYVVARDRSTYLSSATGELRIATGDSAVTMVIDLGRAGFTFTLQANKYGSGSGTYTLYMRGRSTSFSFTDDESDGPAWEEYTGSIDRAWRYIQLRVVAA